MAEANIISLDSDDDCEYTKEKDKGTDTEKEKQQEQQQQQQPEKELIECPICLQTCIHPARLPCGHIFCFLCVKGVAYKNRRCAMCRREIPVEFLEHPQLVYGVQDNRNSAAVTEDGFMWFYEGRNGWWQYDERTCQDIEDAYKKGEKFCNILVAGYVYVVDFESMLQQRQNDPSRKRQVKRDLATTPKKGVAGLRIDGTTDSPNTSSSSTDSMVAAGGGPSSASASSSSSVATNLISTIVATDAAIRIASDIIDSTLAHADEYSSPQRRRRNISLMDGGTDGAVAADSSGGGAAGGSGDQHQYLSAAVNATTAATPTCRNILDEVEETLNISNAQSINTPPNLEDFFSLTIDEFRSLALSNIADTSSDSDDDDDDDDDDIHYDGRNNYDDDDDEDDDHDDRLPVIL